MQRLQELLCRACWRQGVAVQCLTAWCLPPGHSCHLCAHLQEQQQQLLLLPSTSSAGDLATARGKTSPAGAPCTCSQVCVCVCARSTCPPPPTPPPQHASASSGVCFEAAGCWPVMPCSARSDRPCSVCGDVPCSARSELHCMQCTQPNVGAPPASLGPVCVCVCVPYTALRG